MDNQEWRSIQDHKNLFYTMFNSEPLLIQVFYILCPHPC